MCDSLNYLTVGDPNDLIRTAHKHVYLRKGINLYRISAYFCSCVQYL